VDLLQLTRHVLESLGVEISALFPPDRSGLGTTWASDSSTPESFHETQIAAWRRRGLVRARQLLESSRMPMHFASWSLWRHGIAAEWLRDHAESSPLESARPCTALQHLRRWFAGSSTLGSLVVVDWWDALSDDSSSI